MNMREIINRINEGLRPMPASAPPFFYHGTNLAAGCMILRDGVIRADNPVDDDDLGAVVCVTDRERVGRMFAIEFVRQNSEYPVGVVFKLDAMKVMRDFQAVPYEAETAGHEDEAEFRVKANIPLKPYCLGLTLVGDFDQLSGRDFDPKSGNMYSLKERIFVDHQRRFPGGWKEFSALWTRLMRKAKREASQP